MAVDTVAPNLKRSPLVAGLSTILLPGLGHLYAGRPRQALYWYVGVQVLLIVSIIVCRSLLFLPVVSLVAMVAIPLMCYVLSVRSAVRLARSTPHYATSRWNKWFVYAAVFIVASTISSLMSDAIREVVLKAYKMPSASMAPTLLTGDHVLVDRLANKLGKRPERGDVVVFKFPEDETKDFLKRIVGTPGDVVEIRNKQLIVNGITVDDERYTQRVDPTVIDSIVNPRDNFGPVTVPDRSYFVLGDNRDQSLDSRFWGFVDISKIKGKVWVVYWSWGGQGQWTEWVRWDRIGRAIE